MSVGFGRVNLEPVVVAVEIGRRDFDVVANLAQLGLLTKPTDISPSRTTDTLYKICRVLVVS